MILIIEGVDKVGKSTIIRDLKEYLTTVPIVFKLSEKPKNNSISERQKVQIAYHELFYQAKKLSDEGKLIIFDRAYPSEMVYSVKREYEGLDNQEWWDFDLHLSDRKDIVLIYFTAPLKIIQQRFIEDHEDFAKLEEIEMLANRYDKFLQKTKLPYFIINSDKDRTLNLLSLKEFIIKR